MSRLKFMNFIAIHSLCFFLPLFFGIFQFRKPIFIHIGGWLLNFKQLMLYLRLCCLRLWLGAYRNYRTLLIWIIQIIVSSSTIRRLLSIIFNNFIDRFTLFYKHFCHFIKLIIYHLDFLMLKAILIKFYLNYKNFFY